MLGMVLFGKKPEEGPFKNLPPQAAHLSNNYYYTGEMESAKLHEGIYSDLQFWTTRYHTRIIDVVEYM
jgi:hypothetical protein